MRGIITVVGIDKVGIIAEVCTLLAKNQINILDISQTITGGYFHMENSIQEFHQVSDVLDALGNQLGLQIKLQHEDIFQSMHRI